MYRTKVPKSEKPDISLYTIHHCHSTSEPKAWYKKDDYIRVMSIDPGKRNFCFRIELRFCNKDKIITEAYEKIDLLGTQNTEKVTIDYINRNVLMVLDNYINLILNCDLIIIERQLSENYRMVRFSQHIITYLMVKVRDNSLKTVIMEIDSKLKTKMLNAPRKLNKREVKLWSIEKATEILTLRKDENSLNVLQKAKSKKDDLADTVIQIEAVFVMIHESNAPIVPDNCTQLFNTKNSVGFTLSTINSNLDQ